MDKKMEQMTVGRYTVTVLRDSPFWVEAPTLFHIVPRALWGRCVEPDREDRLPVALNSLLLQSTEENILIDAGIGNRYTEKMARIYNLDPGRQLLDRLAETGLSPGDITKVVLTHLHLDHTGWCVVNDASGDPCPTFPNARYIVQKNEWEGAHNTNELTRGSYILEDIEPVAEAGQLDITDGQTEVAPGITVILTGAHSPGHQVVMVQDGGLTLLCPCEILPDRHHTRIGWVMCYDLMPGMVVEVKRTLLAVAARDGWQLFLSHETGPALGILEETNGSDYRFVTNMERERIEK